MQLDVMWSDDECQVWLNPEGCAAEPDDSWGVIIGLGKTETAALADATESLEKYRREVLNLLFMLKKNKARRKK
jgi:hypothetical protein